MYRRVIGHLTRVVYGLGSIPILSFTASLSRGYCLEMICADFLAAGHFEGSNSDSLLFALSRLYSLLPDPQKLEFVQQMEKSNE